HPENLVRKTKFVFLNYLKSFQGVSCICRAHTRVWQKWRFSGPKTHLWLIKVWFSASTFVVKIATFAKPETVRL
ncbi:hypothetical protein, partial [Paenimyroides viscosum]|uniref:hypothetical protein n=1 Tax=Paenimyroides viscosum TaxID=2488729 RepID=UPI0019394083